MTVFELFLLLWLTTLTIAFVGMVLLYIVLAIEHAKHVQAWRDQVYQLWSQMRLNAVGNVQVGPIIDQMVDQMFLFSEVPVGHPGRLLRRFAERVTTWRR